MKKTLFITSLLLSSFFLCISVTAQSNTTTVNFKIKNIGVYVDGSFSKAKVSSNFDKNNLTDSFINAIIEINSINTANKKRDKHLLESDYFDEANYKQMKLVSTKIEKVSSNTYKITGKLTIKKTTKTVTIPLIINDNGQLVKMNANFELNRRDYGVGGSSWVLSNTVKIEVKHTVKK